MSLICNSNIENIPNVNTYPLKYVFDELVNYPRFDGDKGELKVFYEFVNENFPNISLNIAHDINLKNISY